MSTKKSAILEQFQMDAGGDIEMAQAAVPVEESKEDIVLDFEAEPLVLEGNQAVVKKTKNMKGKAFIFTCFDMDAKDKLIELCNKKHAEKRGIIMLRFQGEVCPTTGRPHIQGYIELTCPQRISALVKWLPGAHFEVRKGTPDQARDYCMEEDTRVAGPWERGVYGGAQGKRSDIDGARDAILAGATRREVYNVHSEVAAKYPRYVDTMLRFAREDAVDKILEIEALYPYQQLVLDLVEEEPDSRTVNWFYDPVGNHGKTYLSKYLVDAKGAFYTNGGKSVDLAYAYNGESIVIFDYVRESEEYVGYGVIEQLKNGIAMSTKYESVTKRFQIPHVIVMANFMPAKGKLSQDRIKLITI